MSSSSVVKVFSTTHYEEKTMPAPREVGNELLDPHIYDDHGDPHRAALEDLNQDPKVNLSTWLAVFFLGFTFIPSLAFTILTVFAVLVPIALDLEGSTANVGWMASGWSLAGSVAFAIAGQLSDYFGRKNILLFGQVLLIIGHIIGATAQSVNQCIVAMTILGFGCGTTFVYAFLLFHKSTTQLSSAFSDKHRIYPAISELLPNVYRSIGLASTDGQVFLFSMFGPLLSRALVQHATWRWLYYLGIITGVIALVGTIVFYTPPSQPLQDRTRRQVLKELDYLGIFLYTCGVTLFLLSLGWGGGSYPWKSAAVLVPLLLGILLFVCTFLWGFSGIPKRPLVPLRLFKKFREFTSLVIVIFVTGLVFISISSLIPEEIGYVYTSDETKAGYYNIAAGTGALGGVIFGALVYKFKHIPAQLMVAIGIQSIAVALMGLITPDRLVMGLVFQFFANLPFSWVLTICYVTVGLHVPQRDIGLAYGLIGSSRFLGGAVGTAIFSTVLSNKAVSEVPARVATAVVRLGYPAVDVPSLVAALASGSAAGPKGIAPQIVEAAADAMRWGYCDAFKVAWFVSIPFGVVAFLTSIVVRDPSPYFTAHTAVTLEKQRLRSSRNHKGFEENNAGIQLESGDQARGEISHVEG